MEQTAQLWLFSPTGTLLLPGVPLTGMEWTLEERAFGVLRASGPYSELDPAYLAEDTRFEIHRFVDGTPLPVVGNTQFFLRAWTFAEDRQGAQTWSIEAYTPEYWLTGRIIDSYASTEGAVNPLTTKTGPADDLMKYWVEENIGTQASINRIVNLLVVEGAQALAQTTSKACAWVNLKTVLDDLAEDSTYLGTYLTYGIEYAAPFFFFKTWINQRGADRSSTGGKPYIVSKEMGSLAEPSMTFDYRDVATAVRGGGQGEGINRVTAYAEDTRRSTNTPFAFRDRFLQSNSTDSAAILADCQAELGKYHPRVHFEGKLQLAGDEVYGQTVGYGDRVTAEYRGYAFDCRIDREAGRYTREGGLELDVRLRGII